MQSVAAVVALALAVFAQGVRALGAAVEQDWANVPSELVTACNTSVHCSDYVMERACVLDADHKVASLTLNPGPDTVYVGVVVDLTHALFYNTRAAMCGLDLFNRLGYNLQNITFEPIFLLQTIQVQSVAEGMLCLNLLNEDVKVVVGPHSDRGVVPAITMGKLFEIANFGSMVYDPSFSDSNPNTGYPLAVRVGLANEQTVEALLEFVSLVEVVKYGLIVLGDEGFHRTILDSTRYYDAQYGLDRVSTELLAGSTTLDQAKSALLRLTATGVRSLVYIVDPFYTPKQHNVSNAALQLGMFSAEYQWFGHVWPQFVVNNLNVEEDGVTKWVGDGILFSILDTDWHSPFGVPLEECLHSNDGVSADYHGLAFSKGALYVPHAIVMDTMVSALMFLGELHARNQTRFSEDEFANITHGIEWRGTTGTVSFDENFERQSIMLRINNTYAPNATNAVKIDGVMTLLVPPNETIYSRSQTTRPPDYVMDCSASGVFIVSVSNCSSGREVTKNYAANDTHRYCPMPDPYMIPCDHIEHSSAIGAIVISGLSIVLNLVCVVILLIHWGHPMIRSGQREWLLTLCIGGLLCEISFPLFGIGAPDASNCVMSGWFISIGSVLMLGSLVVKLWRIKRLMLAKTFKKTRVGNAQLAAYVMAMLLVNIVLLIVTEVVSPVSVEEVQVFTSNGDAVFNTQCFREATWPNFVVSGYIALIAIYACSLANEARSLPSALSEGSFVFVAVYNATVTAAMVFAFSSFASDSNVVAMVTAVGLLLSCSGTVILILYKRFHCIFFMPAGTDWNRYITESNGNPRSNGAATTSFSTQRSARPTQ